MAERGSGPLEVAMRPGAAVAPGTIARASAPQSREVTTTAIVGLRRRLGGGAFTAART